jgi:hypothetical protein
MFRHHKLANELPIASSHEESVRLLNSPEELQAAIERAREFERREVAEFQRRVRAYDRFLDRVESQPVKTVPIVLRADASD